MSETDKSDSTIWVLKKMVVRFLLLLFFALCVFKLQLLFDLPGVGVTISISLLFILPFTLGAIATFINDSTGTNPKISKNLSGPAFVLEQIQFTCSRILRLRSSSSIRSC